MTRQPVHLNQQKTLSAASKDGKHSLNNTPGQALQQALRSVDTLNIDKISRQVLQRIPHLQCNRVGRFSEQSRPHK